MNNEKFSNLIQEQTQTNGMSHAVVIGGSLAGLFAARVLVDYFDTVTIIERDRLPDEAVARKGVPQGRHLHVLLARGRAILEQLFPGIQQQLAEASAPMSDLGADVAWLTPAGWGVRFESGIGIFPSSRNLLELCVRNRVSSLPRIRVIDECDVTSLASNAEKDRINGVRLKLRTTRLQGDADLPGHIEADLVVDASGRGTKTPQWLAELGYAPPEETVINAFLGYASRIYREPASRRDWQGIYVQAAPPVHTRGGILFPIEGGRWLVTLVGLGRDYPPTDEAGFLEFARSLRTPMIYDAIKDAEPLTDISIYRATENRVRHYERLVRQPEGLIVMGDAACAFNPVYGQGMTTAALGAETLRECLANQRARRGGRLDGLAARFQKRLAKANSAAWMLATGEDLRVPEVVGKKPGLADRVMQRYVDRVVELSTEDARARLALLEVFNLLKPPTTLFHPAILARMLKRGFRSKDSELRAHKDTGVRIQGSGIQQGNS